ncbi:DnaT-like ssDNA-binding domain-containing protein [Zooshikella ganghwensis]|uniref:Helix-turn-helix domain-containing protein n=1 Tax=Zooshikella ganghwensis TaxID=202772 RepID=A0A4P9VEX7_9GAMM|nr:DnaT-like ssDNA-binding domain-containing protein [Zooshikella ganghwensis]RDH41618.1 helix-turn-helix domain-containing protein [Zooshikella ganghwensis]
MSVKASNWVFDLSLKPAIKLVLLALADQSDDEGVSWPSMNTIAKKASCSVNTARRHIRQLEKMQLVESELRERHNGSYSSNRYKIFIGREPINLDDFPDSGPDSDDDQNSDYLPETPNDEAPTNLGGAKSSPPNFGGRTPSGLRGPEPPIETTTTASAREAENRSPNVKQKKPERDPREHPIFQRGKQHDQNPEPPVKNTSGKSMTGDWEPDWDRVQASLVRAGIDPVFATLRFDEFVLYWSARPEVKQPCWTARFIQHLIDQWPRYQSRQQRTAQVENALNEKAAAQIKNINQETQNMEVSHAIKSATHSENAAFVERLTDTNW